MVPCPQIDLIKLLTDSGTKYMYRVYYYNGFNMFK